MHTLKTMEAQINIDNLNDCQCLCLATRVARRILPLLVYNDAESRIETAASMDYGLFTAEQFCRTGELLGCGIKSYNGPNEPLRKVGKAVKDSVLLKAHFYRKIHHKAHKFWPKSPTVQEIVDSSFAALTDLVSQDAAFELHQAIRLDIENLQTLQVTTSIDPTPEGPLGPIWIGNDLEWQNKLTIRFNELLEGHKGEIRNHIENSLRRSGPVDLSNQYKNFFSSIGYERKPNPCPLLEEIIISAYDASMQQEEGRPVRFQLQLLRDDTIIQIPFSSAYSSKNLVKLSPVVGVGFRHLIVSPNLSGDTVEIVGISDLEHSSDKLQRRALWSPFQGTNLSTKDVDFRLKVLGPGYIQISDSSSTWELRNGSIRHFQPISSIKSVQSWLRETSNSFNGSISVSQFALSRIVQKMVQAQHGGTIIVVGQSNPQLKPKFEIDTNVLREAIEESIQMDSQFTRTSISDVQNLERAYSSTRTLMRAIDSVAALTFIDGATVIKRDFGVIGFGAEISYDSKSSNDEVECLAMVVGVGHGTLTVGTRKMSDFGMRHRSAYSFCKKNKDAIAIVVSQDGGLRIFCSERDKGVVLYQNVVADSRAWGWTRKTTTNIIE